MDTLVFLLITLNIVHIFFYCFHCWIWRGNCLLDSSVLFYLALIQVFYSDMEKQSLVGVLWKRCSLNISQNSQKNMCQSLLLNKNASLRPATLLRKRPWHRGFPVNFAKFLRTLFFIEHFRWLLLQVFVMKLQ